MQVTFRICIVRNIDNTAINDSLSQISIFIFFPINCDDDSLFLFVFLFKTVCLFKLQNYFSFCCSFRSLLQWYWNRVSAKWFRPHKVCSLHCPCFPQFRLRKLSYTLFSPVMHSAMKCELRMNLCCKCKYRFWKNRVLISDTKEEGCEYDENDNVIVPLRTRWKCMLRSRWQSRGECVQTEASSPWNILETTTLTTRLSRSAQVERLLKLSRNADELNTNGEYMPLHSIRKTVWCTGEI